MSHPAFALALAAALSLGMAACAAPASTDPPSVLLFAGTGTSANDVTAVEGMLKQMRVEYATATSPQLNGMSKEQLMRYRLLIVPGGNFIMMGDSLTPTATATMHEAVQDGLNYLGICAGAFLAGRASYRSLDLTSGVRFGFYSAAQRGIRKTAVMVSRVDGPPLDQYWEDGPQLQGWGDVVAKYPDGTPAVAQGMSGQGWVILAGIHPEAPERWRRGISFTTRASVDNAYAAVLIDAALRGTRLPHY